MSIEQAAAALRIWAARHNLTSTQTESQILEGQTTVALVQAAEEMFAEIDGPIQRAVNARRVHAVAFNAADSKIIVYLQKTFTKAQTAVLPDAFDGFAIEYRAGTLGALGGPPPPALGAATVYVDGDRICCGSSIGLGGSMGAGTLGALVRIGGDLYGLTNNHVIGRCNYAEEGHPVLTPGNIDMGPTGAFAPFTVGRYSLSAPLTFGSPSTVDASGNLDAAVMKIVDADRVSSRQGGHYVTPAETGALEDGMIVRKVGRTTGLTSGKVMGKVAGFQPVTVAMNEINLRNTLYFSEAWIVESDAGQFSTNGDSGSLVVGEDFLGATVAVGLVFAGDANMSLVVPLEPILAALGATLESVHGL